MINFDEASHTYTTEVEGAEMVVPSVSTILSHILELDYTGIDPFYADRGTFGSHPIQQGLTIG